MNTDKSSIPLAKVRQSGSYKILPFEPQSSAEERLMEMGLYPGAKVTWVRSSPLGDPVHITINQTALSIRRRDFGSICVAAV
jgi:ferrous iron transport protein A